MMVLARSLCHLGCAVWFPGLGFNKLITQELDKMRGLSQGHMQVDADSFPMSLLPKTQHGMHRSDMLAAHSFSLTFWVKQR